MGKIMNDIIYVKIIIDERVYKKNIFILNNVLLYKNLTDNHDVTAFFKNNSNTSVINKDLIKDIYKTQNIEFEDNNDIRLKIFFTYNNIDYIIYFPFNIDTHIPYPPFNETIMNNYRNNIVNPTYVDKKNTNLYSLFTIESKDMLYIKINDEIRNDLMKYFMMIKTPFNDFGILYNAHVKLLWVLYENKIDVDTFESFHLKFLNMYFDENEMDLKEHIIDLTKNDIDKNIISKRMETILN